MNDTENNVENTEIRKVEIMIGKVMQVGVLIATIFMAVGILLLFVTGQSGYAGSQYPHSFALIWSGLIQFKSYAVIMSGLFLLILTPVLRVVVSIYAFYVAHDKLYVWITTAVLIILIFAMVIGMYGV